MNSKLNFEGLNTLLRQLVARENTVEHGSEGGVPWERQCKELREGHCGQRTEKSGSGGV